MSEMSRELMLSVVRSVYDDRDPVPDGLVTRMQAAAREAADDLGFSLEVELMTLLERSSELVGTRSDAATRAVYTLRFVHGQVDLLLRVAPEGERSRIDGWVVPPEPITVRVVHDDGSTFAAIISDTGRFEIPDVPLGLVRLRLEPHDDRAPFVTPSFEI
ncbi:hypothetical protein [Nocardioides sp. CER19]|uniref:hypothetical protein n=1 Tax=Nocardioides sp. CER19 TaxID=3038538 RepID=UPI00244A3A0D|nr:hypothetical protein [Nocardioides sp. CER19]MDH2412824.1 hypothetical protein [Nocardioides sp. CER19]